MRATFLRVSSRPRRRTMFSVLLLLLLSLLAPAARGQHVERYNGSDAGTDVMLQGFHWQSNTVWDTGANPPKPKWYRIVQDNAQAIKDAGFTVVWFPPPSSTVDWQGYLPNQWYELDTRYGTEQELKNAIKALDPAKAIADMVLNHRNGQHGGGHDFANPAFADNKAAVVRNDECDCGSGPHESYAGFHASRDLNHEHPSVQEEIRKWQAWLKNEVGFAGWRYDMVKGYPGRFVGIYNDASKPYLSVGEYWDDDRQKVVDWVDATKDGASARSMAFDFPTRHNLREATVNRDFGRLKTVDGKPTGVIGWWPQVSVTFVENHDTEEARGEGKHFPNFKGEVMQAYAYILTHPGVPCVFWTHYFDWGPDQKDKLTKLIAIRKQQGIHSRSVVDIKKADDDAYAAIIDSKVAMKIGPGAWSPEGAEWAQPAAVDGESFAVWVKKPGP